MDLIFYDKTFSTRKIVHSYTSVIWTERFWAAGDFELCLLASSDAYSLFTDYYYCELLDSEVTMYLSGIEEDSDLEEASSLIIHGYSLENMLTRRVVLTLTTLTGNLQDCIETLLNDAIINPADSNRKIDDFIFSRSSDSYIESLTLSIQLLGDNLYTVICNICELYKIGFKIRRMGTSFVFSLYSGEDRSYSQITNPRIVFSPGNKNLLSVNYTQDREPYKNVILVGGEGDGSNKITTVVDSANLTGWDRRETYLDSSSTSSNTEAGNLTASEYLALLTTEGEESLAESPIEELIDCEADVTGSHSYNVDYFVGDIVQVNSEYGLSSDCRITELIRSDEESGYIVYPTFSVE